MRSSFKAREGGVQAIALRDEHIVFGPFCVHCGTPIEYHSQRGRRCPVSVGALFPPPSCECHGVLTKS